MQTKRNIKETGNVLICVLGAILILSLIGANVLQSSATRLNASSNHVRAWKEALSAAETGGEIAFAQLRKELSDPANQWSTTAWINSVPNNVPVPGFPKGTKHVLSPVTTFGSNNLQAQTVVEACYFDPTPGQNQYKLTLVDASTNPPRIPPGNPWYRIRSKGTAPLPNLKRTGMDDAVITDTTKHFAAFGSTGAIMQDITARGKGDSLLRKIDFNTDHFIATYGPDGDGLNKALVPPSSSPNPSISRRIEQLVAPVTPFFDAAIKASGSFYGLGPASYIDSYDSRNGPYDSTVKTNPSSPYYSDSRHGNVEIASATATVKGDIYGDVATNGGNVVNGSPGNIYGTIDNNVPFVLENYVMPSTTGWNYVSIPTAVTAATTLTPSSSGTTTQPNYYLFSSISNALTLNPALVSGSPVDTYVNIRVTGDISGANTGIVVNPKVHVTVFFDGNIDVKANKIINQNPSTANPYAGNLQFYGISPTTSGRVQTVKLDSGGGQPTVAATFYAPSADVEFKGAPDFIGTVVCKSFFANGNITWHYDRALNDDGTIKDFRIASYVEDTR